MELLGIVEVPLWSVYAVAILVTIMLYLIYANRNKKYEGPSQVLSDGSLKRLPGPKPSGWLGFFSEIREKGLIQFDCDIVKEHGELVNISASRRNEVMVSDLDLVREILSKQAHCFINRQVFFTATVLDHSLLNLKGDHWKHVRSVMTPTFSSGKLRKVAQLIRDSGDTLLANIAKIHAEGKEFDVKKIFANFTLDALSATAFGIKCDSQTNPDAPIVKNAEVAVDFDLSNKRLIFFALLQPVVKYLRKMGISYYESSVNKFWRDLTDQLLLERQSAQQEGKYKDFLQLILNASNEAEQNSDGEAGQKGMTTEELHGNVLLFFIAGYDTTSQTLLFFTYLLAINPEWQEKVIQEVDDVLQGAEPDYDNVQKLKTMEMCFSESLRLFPPGFRLDRTCTEDVTINGNFFPKDTVVNIPVWAMHHSEKYFPEPEKFDPERFTPEANQKRNPYTYLPFGMGPRNCVGIRLAQMEIKIIMAMVFQKYKFLPCDKTQIPLVISKHRPIRPDKDVWLKVAKRDA